MADLVIDTNVFIISMVPEANLDDEGRKQRPLALQLIESLHRGDHVAHLPMAIVIEVCGVARRDSGEAQASVIKRTLLEWAGRGAVKLYELTGERMGTAIDLVVEHNLSRKRFLSAPDAMLVTLGEELGADIISFEKYFEKVSTRVVIPS